MTTATITPSEAGATSLSSSAITISDLTVRFSSKRADVTALDDIDLQVADRQAGLLRLAGGGLDQRAREAKRRARDLAALGPGGAMDEEFALVTITYARLGEPSYGIAAGRAELQALLAKEGAAAGARGKQIAACRAIDAPRERAPLTRHDLTLDRRDRHRVERNAE